MSSTTGNSRPAASRSFLSFTTKDRTLYPQPVIEIRLLFQDKCRPKLRQVKAKPVVFCFHHAVRSSCTIASFNQATNRPTPISVFSDQRRTKSITWSRTSCGTQLPVRVPQDFFLARRARPSTRPGPRPWSAPSSPRTQSVSASPPPGGGAAPATERQPLRSRRTPSASGRTPSAAGPLPHTSPRPEPCPKGGASEWPPSPLPCNAFVPFSYVRSAILTDERFLHFQLRQDTLRARCTTRSC